MKTDTYKVDEIIPPKYLYLLLLSLWSLLIFWLRPWAGDLKSDPLTYACISKDMVQNHHWLSPTLDGEPYLNKPPLYFWLVALSFKLFGISFYTARIPSLIMATADVFLLYLIVLKWFHDREIAFFSSLSFLTTRWIFMSFASNRPESLLVFTVLLGMYAFTLMNERDSKGPYILGISFAIALLAKQLFAVFIPSAILIYGVVSKKMFRWLKWPHFYFGAAMGLALSLPWFIYYEVTHPGYIGHQIYGEALPMVMEGADVNKDPFMYLKEMLLYYHPWLIFFLIGIFILCRRLRDEYLLFVFLTVIVMFVPLQISKGKASRYLTSITPFFSVVVSLGIMHFYRVKNIMKAFSAYAVIPLFLVFWMVPMKINPEKFHVLHLAERIAKNETVDYRDTFAFIKTTRERRGDQIQFVEWSPVVPPREYRHTYFFYLSEYFTQWDDNNLDDWVRDGNYSIILITHPATAQQLPSTVKWVKIASDQYHLLLAGVK